LGVKFALTKLRFDWNKKITVIMACVFGFNPATVRLEYLYRSGMRGDHRFNPATVRLECAVKLVHAVHDRFQPRNGSIGMRSRRNHTNCAGSFNPATVRLEYDRSGHDVAGYAFQPRNGSIGISR